jgi:hypothetical protein
MNPCAHLKCIGYTLEAEPLLTQAGIKEERDQRIICLTGNIAVSEFVKTVKQLRLWTREEQVKQF